VTDSVTETSELRVLSGIVALVLDEQPGQSGAALETLRRRAASSRVTGGALRNLFERLSSEDHHGPTPQQRGARQDIHRLQQDLDVAMVQGSRLAAENGALHYRLAEAERRLYLLGLREIELRRRANLVAGPRPPPNPPARHHWGLVAGLLIGLLATILSHDRVGAPANRHGNVASWVAHAATP
jgi:hypothetical protein